MRQKKSLVIKFIHQFKLLIQQRQQTQPQSKADSFWKVSFQSRRRSYQGLPQACMKHTARQARHFSSGRRPSRQITNRRKQGKCWLRHSCTRATTRQKWHELSWTRETVHQSQWFWAQNSNFLDLQDRAQAKLSILPSCKEIQVEALALLPDTIRPIMVKLGPQQLKICVMWRLHHIPGVAEETPKCLKRP